MSKKAVIDWEHQKKEPGVKYGIDDLKKHIENASVHLNAEERAQIAAFFKHTDNSDIHHSIESLKELFALKNHTHLSGYIAPKFRLDPQTGNLFLIKEESTSTAISFKLVDGKLLAVTL